MSPKQRRVQEVVDCVDELIQAHQYYDLVKYEADSGTAVHRLARARKKLAVAVGDL